MRILVIDDHALFREGVRWMLERLGAGTEVLEAGSVEDGLVCLREHAPINLLLLDLYLPGYRELEALSLFRQELPDGCIVLLSGSDDPALIRAGLANGAQGFIHKSVSADELRDAVAKIMRLDGCTAAPKLPVAAVPQLTARQRQILALVCKGKSYKEIARQLVISDSTVRNHVVRIFALLDVHSRTEAAMVAYRHGLVA